LMIGGTATAFDLGPWAPTLEDRSWRASSEPVTPRQCAYLDIRSALRDLGEDERQAAMETIRSSVPGHCAARGSNRAMTTSEVEDLVTDGLISIGAHTVTHPALTDLGDAASLHEIGASKLACEAMLDAPVDAFAYPYGEHNANVRAIVESAGFAYACSTQPGPAGRFSDLFALPRIQVLDWDGDVFEKALRLASVGG
jgi:peptidoglycan/xylan/chitin deacetylase (PgdA/CDA1 family)